MEMAFAAARLMAVFLGMGFCAGMVGVFMGLVNDLQMHRVEILLKFFLDRIGDVSHFSFPYFTLKYKVYTL